MHGRIKGGFDMSLIKDARKLIFIFKGCENPYIYEY